MEDLDWEIRVAADGDIDAMLGLWKDIEGLNSVPESLASVKRFIKINPDGCLVAMNEGRLIGTAMAGFDGWRGCVYRLAVNKDFRLKGVGQALLEQCLEVFEQQGAPKAYLYVKANNHNALAFYNHLQWEKRDDIMVFDWDFMELP